MKDEPMERDRELGALLAAVSGSAPVNEVDWDELRRSTVARASSARLHGSGKRVSALLGTALAASVALLFMVTRSGEGGGGAGALGGDTPTLEEILASDVSDDQLRELLAGAGGVEALLLLAASEDER